MKLISHKEIVLHPENENIVSSTSPNYSSIDIMKFICSILVVCIHTSPLTNISYILNFGLINILARLAVPFFFLTSGYFLFKKIDNRSSNYFEKDSKYFAFYIKRLGILYVLWNGIYLINTFYTWSQNGEINFRNILDAIRGFLFIGIAVHLWYIAGLILAVILVYFSLKHISIRNTLFIGALLYIIGLLGDSYFGIIKDVPIIGSLFKLYNFIFITTRNGLFFGFLFVAVGAYLSKITFLINTKKLCILFCCSFLLLTTEALTLKYFHIPKDYNTYVFLVPCTIFLFLLLLKIEFGLHPIYIHLRNLSVLIYFSHIIFTIIYSKLSEVLNLINLYQNSMIRFSLIMISSFIFSIILLWVSQHKNIEFLKKFY